MKWTDLSLSSVVRKLVGGIVGSAGFQPRAQGASSAHQAPMREKEKDRRWRDPRDRNAGPKSSAVEVEDNIDRDDNSERSEEYQTLGQRPAEKNECKTNQSTVQEQNTSTNEGRTVFNVVASEIIGTTLDIKKEPLEDKSEPLSELVKPDNSRIGSTHDKFATTKPHQSKALCVTDSTEEGKLGSSKSHPESEPATSGSGKTKNPTDQNNECNVERNKDYDKVLEAIKDLKLRSKSEPAEKQKEDRNLRMLYKSRGPPGFDIFGEAAGKADESMINSILSGVPQDFQPASSITVEETLDALEPVEQLCQIMEDEPESGLYSDDSSAVDSGIDDFSTFGDFYTPPAPATPHDSLVNRHATPLTSPSSHSMDSSMDSSMSSVSSMSSPDSVWDAQGSSAFSPLDSPFSDQSDITKWASTMSNRTLEVVPPYHAYMRTKLYRDPICAGYSSSKAPRREPQLIGFLKDAAENEPDYQKIYESARCYLWNHVSLMYDECSAEEGTVLYYAARLHKEPKIVGFIVECLLEAQATCSLIIAAQLQKRARARLVSPEGTEQETSWEETPYMIEHERYGELEDNILHCLARWHNARTNYINVAMTLFDTCNTLSQLKCVWNKEGKFPYQLCPARDEMRDLLGGPKSIEWGAGEPDHTRPPR